jgi:hypothetical protein
VRTLAVLATVIAQIAAGYLLYAARMLGHAYAASDLVAFHLPLIVGAVVFRATFVRSRAMRAWPPRWRNAIWTLIAIALALLVQLVAMTLGASRYGS